MLLRAVSCLALALALNAQTPAVPANQTDLTANNAPLSTAERDDLRKAVAAHNYVAEKAVLDKAAAENPQSAEVQILAARLAFIARQPNDAVKAFQAAEKIKPLSADDRASLALAYEGMGMKKEALATISKLVTEFPKNSEYAYLKGRLEIHYQNDEAAIANFQRAISIDPNNVRAYVDLGQAQEALGQPEEARKNYERAVARNRTSQSPSDTPPLRLGELLMKADELDAAEKLFNEALRYRPRSGWAHYDLAQLDTKREKRSDAIAEYRAAVVNDPTLRQAWLALGREYTRTGQKAEAEKCLAIFKKLEADEKQSHSSVLTPAAQVSPSGKTP